MSKEIVRKIDGIVLKLRKAGSFPDKSTGKLIEYEDAIVISAGKKDVTISALFLAGLRKILEYDVELLDELGKRLDVERKNNVDVSGVGFNEGK